MINFVTIDTETHVEATYEAYIFNSIEEMLKIYWDDDRIYEVPAMDDEVFNGTFIMNDQVYYADTFADIVEMLQKTYWKNVNT